MSLTANNVRKRVQSDNKLNEKLAQGEFVENH